VVLADGHCLFRAGVQALLNDEIGIEVVAELEDGRSVEQELLRTHADILLLDLNLPHVDGYQLLGRLRTAGASARPIVLTGVRDPEKLSRSIDLGARGVVAKKAPTRQMIEAIRAVHTGLRWLDPALRFHTNEANLPKAARLGKSGVRGNHPAPWSRLTPRECEVAGLVAEGHRYREVAQRLAISEHTLKNHLRHIFEKLGIRSRVQLALSGMQQPH
jgi:DNA-binding NarL/FixJ family response regulator